MIFKEEDDDGRERVTEEEERAKSAKISNRYIFKTIHRISIKFNRPMWPGDKTSWVVLHDDVTNPRCRTAAILDFDFPNFVPR